MSTFKNKNSLRTIEAQIAQKLIITTRRLGQTLLVLIKKSVYLELFSRIAQKMFRTNLRVYLSEAKCSSGALAPTSEGRGEDQ